MPVVDLTLPMYDFMPVGNVWAWDVPYITVHPTDHEMPKLVGEASPTPSYCLAMPRPPSTIRVVPVTKDDSSQARKRTALAISIGCALRFKMLSS